MERLQPHARGLPYCCQEEVDELEHQAGADSVCRRSELRVWCTGESWVAVVEQKWGSRWSPSHLWGVKGSAQPEARPGLCPWVAPMLPGTGQGYARPPDSLQPGGGQLLGAVARSVDRSSGCRQGSVEKFAGPGLDKGSFSTEEQLKYD